MSWLIVGLLVALVVCVVLALVLAHGAAVGERQRQAELRRQAEELQARHVRLRVIDRDDWGVGEWQE